MPLLLRRCSLLGAALALLLLSAAAFAQRAEPLSKYAALGYVPDEVLVKFKPGVKAATKAAVNQALQATTLRVHPHGGYHVMKLRKGASMAKAVAAYSRQSSIAWAEPNYIVSASYVPDDPYYDRQWNFYNPVYKGINVEGAWDIILGMLPQLGSPGIKVAVLDTGVAYENYDNDWDGFYEYLKAPDLAGVRFAPGWDFVNGDAHANDDQSHGTHVTGTIAQATNNGYGCAGIASGVTIMPVKVLGADGSGTIEMVADGIYYATNSGAKIINMSLGAYFPSQAERDACWYAYNRGVTVIAAAGNGGSVGIGYPAGFDESVIAVGATDYVNERTFYSDYGPSMDLYWYGYTRGNGLDIMAPGGDTSVDLNLDGYDDGILQQTIGTKIDPLTGFEIANPMTFQFASFNGTSMASPHVAGVAALVASAMYANGMPLTEIKPDIIRGILEVTATDLEEEGYDDGTGWGLVDASAAVEAAAAMLYNAGPTANAGASQTLSDLDGNGLEAVTLNGTASTFSPGFPIISYIWKEGGVMIAEGALPTINVGVGAHTFALTCLDSMGKSSTATTIVTILPGTPIVRVAGITINSQKNRYGRYVVSAQVTITDALNRPISRASVSGRWTGAIVKSMRASTNAQGQVTFSGGTQKTGSYTFEITRVVKSGYTYNPDLNIETSDSRIFY